MRVSDAQFMKRSVGFSTLELMVWIAIAGLLIVGMSALLGRGITSNRFQFEQVLITEDARRQLELVSDTLRNARNEAGNNWLVLAGDNQVAVQTDVNGDDIIDQVRYFLDGNDLKRGITEGMEPEEVKVVARSIGSGLSEQPLFTYFNAERQQLNVSEATSSTVSRIGIAFLVDVNEVQDPDAGEIMTAVKPRSEDTETVRLWPVTLDFPGDPESIDPTAGEVTVTTTNPNTSAETVTTITFADLNDGRLATYTGDYYTHLNYQDQTIGSFLPGWYAWIGPITVGEQGGTLEATDKFSINPASSPPLCIGNSLYELLLNCNTREVESSGFIQRYFPILTYTQLTGHIDYVQDINYVGASSSPSVSPSPSSSPSSSPSPTPTPTSSSPFGL